MPRRTKETRRPLLAWAHRQSRRADACDPSCPFGGSRTRHPRRPSLSPDSSSPRVPPVWPPAWLSESSHCHKQQRQTLQCHNFPPFFSSCWRAFPRHPARVRRSRQLSPFPQGQFQSLLAPPRLSLLCTLPQLSLPPPRPLLPALPFPHHSCFPLPPPVHVTHDPCLRLLHQLSLPLLHQPPLPVPRHPSLPLLHHPSLPLPRHPSLPLPRHTSRPLPRQPSLPPPMPLSHHIFLHLPPQFSLTLPHHPSLPFPHHLHIPRPPSPSPLPLSLPLQHHLLPMMPQALSHSLPPPFLFRFLLLSWALLELRAPKHHFPAQLEEVEQMALGASDLPLLLPPPRSPSTWEVV
mmetsp:Transcript_69593/g.123138  ORF Transcript_69593/g.123138 Transcript_69593/m.123138 type:complete len:348 (+) Transcript_69593:623-1666(+)